MFPLLPLWGLQSILQKRGEKTFRNVGVNESLQKLLAKYTHVSNGLIRTEDIVGRLFQSEVFTPRERDDIQQLLPTPVRANEQLLNTLMLKDDRAYDCLLKALIETDQGHIADILKCEAKYLDIEHSRMIQRNYTTLVDNLDTDCGHLLDRLYEAGTLSHREVATINAKSTKYKKNETLLDLASRFSPANFEKFLRALEESTQEHVASMMTGKQYAQTSTSKAEDSHMQYKESGLKETSRENPVLQFDSIHNFLEEQQQQNGHHRAKIIRAPSTLVKRQSINTMESKFANLPDELQIELSLKVAVLHQKTVLPSGANVELCFRKLLQGFIQQKKRKQLDVEDIRQVFRSFNDSAQNSAHNVEDKFKTEIHILSEELLLHRTNIRHLDETLKANAIELDNEKLKSRGLENQLQENQDESANILIQKDELLKKLDGEFQTLNEELLLHRTNNRHLDEMLKTTVTELDNEKQKSRGLESQLRQNQDESANLLKQKDELLKKLDGEFQSLNEELLLHRTNIRHLDETLKANATELHNEKQKSRGLDSQLRQNQNYSGNLLRQRDELQKAFDDSLTMIDESKNKFENMLRDKDATVSELKQKLEQAMKAWQDEKEQLMNQIKELLDRYSVPVPCERFLPLDVGVVDVITLYMKDEFHTIDEELKDRSGSIYAIKDEPGFFIKGNETGVGKAVKDLLKLAESVVMYDHDIDRPGLPAYFYSRSGSEVLRGIQIRNKVSIQLDKAQSRAKPQVEANDLSERCRVEVRPGKFMTLMSGDITEFRGDAIVNAPNENLKHYGGVAAAIAEAAGSDLEWDCWRHVKVEGRLLPGEACVTRAGKLPCKKVIHTVGPRWTGGYNDEENILAVAVESSLSAADEEGLKSIAMSMSSITTGIFGFPLDRATDIIVDAVKNYLAENSSTTVREVFFIDNDPRAVASLEAKLKTIQADGPLERSELKMGRIVAGRPQDTYYPQHNQEPPLNIDQREDEAHATQGTRTVADPRQQSEAQGEERHPQDLSRIILSIYALSKMAIQDVLKDVEEVIKEHIIDKTSMAGTPGTEYHEKLSDMTECSICAETFRNPKTLPCVHTFCLHCLEVYGKDNNPGDRMTCPICKHEFVIPFEGFSSLPNNFFIGKIVEIGKLASGSAKEPVCDLCTEEAAPAKKFCIDCKQKLCDRCSNSHARIKHCQNHQIVELGRQLNIQELNIRNSYCEHHPKELIKMYCYEDNVAVCAVCCVDNHRSHRCVNVDKAAGELKEQMKDDVGEVAKRLLDCEVALQKLKTFKTKFVVGFVKTEESIRESGIELKKLFDQRTELLVQNSREIRDRNLKSLDTTKQVVNRLKLMIDSYQKYCKEFLARGSAVHICRADRQMHKLSCDLKQLFKNCNLGLFSYETIIFHSRKTERHMLPIIQTGINDIVGDLTVCKPGESISHFLMKIDPDNWQWMNNDEDVKIVQLETSGWKYTSVAKEVFSTAETTVNQIVKIERIQNKLLYRQYVLRKEAIDAANPEIRNERRLWHGASADALETINQNGFFSNCKSEDATTCQRGVYFAKNFSFAAQKEYAKPDANGFKHVYLCNVLIEKCAIGKSSRPMTVPRSEPRSTTGKFDSTVDNIINPTPFVICYSNQAYPEYLIYFK